jgi:hypothetical protein
LVAHRCQDPRIVVTEQERPVAHHVVEQLVAVDVPLARSVRAVNVGREGLDVAAVVVDAAGDHAACLPMERQRPGELLGELLLDGEGGLRLNHGRMPFSSRKIPGGRSEGSTRRL